MIRRREFNTYVDMVHSLRISHNSLVSTVRSLEGEVDLLRNRVDVLRRKEMEIEMWQKVHEGAHDFVLTRGVQGKTDLELLCDYLGVECVDTAAKREVVKVVPANGIDWAFSEEQQKEKK